ncbi:hypothetical protein IDM40_04490 [Nocardiopsis sp. HNM0947]|uniref:Uncharacterized protein n=1 Tax=Nocardiopsis coralli TaxID=2772213 RepID=A0ABR9P299_9ACTN|nr:hypothetical protein [Nocardiopsis coralli]MBE2997970.1 hypothetical protein [Nocardiopsis coralli]
MDQSRYPLGDQRDVIVIADAVLDGGRELTGDEIGHLMVQLDRARLETLWRETHRNYPLGSWVAPVRDAGGRRSAVAQVIGYGRARPGAPGHVLRVRTQQGEERGVSAARVRVVPVPCSGQGGQGQGSGQRWRQKL